MVYVVSNKFGRVTYKLQPSPYEIIRYILHEACRHVEDFCDGALALTQANHQQT